MPKQNQRNTRRATGIELSNRPGTITASQRRKLFAIKTSKGWSDDDLRSAVPGGSISKLSRKQASIVINDLDGPLQNQPGKAPKAYRGPAKGIRIITQQNIEQIERLGREKLSSELHFTSWLKKYFKVDTIRELATAEKAGEVILALKNMKAKEPAHDATRTNA